MKWHTVNVVPSLPDKLKALQRLALNLWYTWNPDAIELWRRLDRDLWDEVYHNPMRLLGRIGQERLKEAGVNESFLLHMDRVLEAFDQYMEIKTPYSFHLENNLDPSFRVAYFSMEYGLTEALPIYSGGLGILSGDHLKSSSNLNLPLVGLGLLYREGYFGQYLNKEGWQQEYYAVNDYENMPIVQEKDHEGNPIEFSMEMGDHALKVNVWRVQVGRIPLYLLNTASTTKHHGRNRNDGAAQENKENLGRTVVGTPAVRVRIGPHRGHCAAVRPDQERKQSDQGEKTLRA